MMDFEEEIGSPPSYERFTKDRIREAEAAGLRVEVGSPTVLQLDLDSIAATHHALNTVKRLGAELGMQRVTMTRSKSGNTHVRVYLNAPGIEDHAQRMLLQALLGSDPVREFLNWRAALAGRPEECILFETPEAREEEFIRG